MNFKEIKDSLPELGLLELNKLIKEIAKELEERFTILKEGKKKK